MPRDSHQQLPLLVGTIGSIGLHLGVIVPVLLLVLASRGEPNRLQAELRPDLPEAEELEPPEQRDPKLGIDAPNPSSLTWVGYEEYEEHMARLSEIEQAAFRTRESGLPEPAMPAPGEVVHEQAPAEEAAAHATESPARDEPDQLVVQQDQIETETPETVQESQGEQMETLPMIAPNISDLLRRIDPMEGFAAHTPERANGPDPGESLEIDAASTPIEQALEDSDAEELPDTAESAEHEDAADQAESVDQPAHTPTDDSSAPSSPPTPAAAAQQGEPDEGEISDREADASSVVQVPPENWRLGRPLAAQGVELKPQRPHFTLLQRLSAAPGNPLVEIRFNRDGVPVHAAIVTSSGSPSIDTFLESSLYRWRASGEDIDNLADGETFNVHIQIIFNPRAARRAEQRSEER